jgi:hypothetical protein
MPTSLHTIRTFKELVRYLEDELDWPLEGYDIEDLTFDYEPDELGLKKEDAAKVKSIRQLRPLDSKQPWGIFFIEFDKKKLPVVVLRRILSHLVVKKRASANKADRVAWSAEDLLFISAFGAEEDDGREISFAHFHQEDGDMPTLRVLGWDGGDTKLKLDHLATTLKQRLRWPDEKEPLDQWRARWAGVFRHRIGHVINTSDMLAEAMAVLAKRIRDAAQTLIERETDKGPLRKLHAAFKTHLIHDLTEEGFADTYAQTITYGLLTAAISRTEMSEGKHGTALVASNVTDMVPVTNPFLKEMLQTFLHVGGRKGGIDFDELGVQDVVELLRGEETDLPAILRDFGNKTRGEDPVIHFYEHFLNAYNKQLRIQRGVFYTPQPVVSYIVRSVHELLQTEFGLEHGLADTSTWGEMIHRSKSKIQNVTLTLPPLTDESGCTETISPDEFFVQILDPATGTATFLVEVIDVIHNHLKDLWKKCGAAAMPTIQNPKSNIQNWNDYWNAYVPYALLPRLHAYELMMAPYAIAHMKIGLKLAETGYRFGTEERARIYLTNALEPWVKQLPLIGFDALAHEAADVNEIKRHKRFTVVIGNPPYSGHSSNNGEWATSLTERYYSIEGVGLNEANTKWLRDDYVKFFGLSQSVLGLTGLGILGFITNHGFIDNPTFRGMRYSLLKEFRSTHVLHLNGSAKKAKDGQIDQNVFDIQQGVAMSLLVLSPGSFESGVNFYDFVGSRETKYSTLAQSSVGSTSWNRIVPAPPFYFFVPEDANLRGEFQAFVKLTDAMPQFSLGCLTKRDELVISFSKAESRNKILSFTDKGKSDGEATAEWGLPLKDKDMWDAASARKAVSAESLDGCIAPIDYRIWDTRYLFAHKDYVARLNRRILAQMERPNMALVTVRQLASLPHQHFWVVNRPSEQCVISTRTKEGGVVFPLYLYHDGSELRFGKTTDISREANFQPDFVRRLSTGMGLSRSEFPTNDLTPEDIFHYAYAVFHSPGYRSRYAEFLKIDFPRLPLTTSLDLFRALARLGGELTALHLLESPKLDKPMTKFVGSSREVVKVGWVDDTVWINAGGTKAKTTAGTSGFHPVPEAVWNFHIGGYQVCEKWLKDRKGRTLTEEDIAHYHKIVIALTETIRLMSEIDQVINTHGGWPGAFQTNA